MSAFIITVPTPNVSVTAVSIQTVGQSLILQCEVITVRNITGRVDIVWSTNGTIVNTTRVTATIMDYLLVYRDYYTISELNTYDDGVMYECRLAVRGGSALRASDTVSLDVTGKYFTET